MTSHLIERLPRDVDSLRALPVPAHLFLPRTMLIVEEIKFLYHLSKDYYSGQGEIIDAGPFCGGSTYAFAAGLHDNSREMATNGRINSYDLFHVDERYTVDYLQSNFYSRYDEKGLLTGVTRSVGEGESFLDVFLFQTQRFRETINVHAGSFLDATWDDRPVEILFIDLAKTVELHSHVFRIYGNCLIPNQTIIIQQDFHHMWHPYIHICMEYMKPYLQIILSNAGATRAYLLKEAIPPEVLERVVRYDFSLSERTQLLRQMVDAALPGEAPVLDLVRVRQSAIDGDLNATQSLINELEAKYKDGPCEGFIRSSIQELIR